MDTQPQALETKDSRSTLVDSELERQHQQQTSTSQRTPQSPFSDSSEATFGLLTPMASPTISGTQPGGTGTVAEGSLETWTTTVSSSLNDLASQFSVAAQRLSTLPPPPLNQGSTTASSLTSADSTVDLAPLLAAQARLEAELEALKEQVSAIGHERRRAEKEKEREMTDDFYREQLETRFLGIEKKLDEVADTIRLDQARLYARLHNATIASNKQTIFALPMANGKTPGNYPATKGEFEHLTKERYEGLLKSYGVNVEGDTAAKRQTLREFIGLSPPANK